jgi:hypothetical protein
MRGERSILPSPSLPEIDRCPAPPRGLRGLLAIAYAGLGRATVAGVIAVIVFAGLPILSLAAGAPRLLFVFSAGVALPAGLLVLPVAGVLQSQRLPLDYRQLGARAQLGLWLRGPRTASWPLPAGALTDPAIRQHAGQIAARSDRILALSRGARAALTAELRSALAGPTDPALVPALIDDAITRIARWEDAAAGLPPIGAKLYLRHDPVSRRAARARRAAARLGVPSDSLNYFWRGQVLLLPPARSHRTLARLIDALLAAGVADAGAPLPLQITVQGDLGDGAKLIALAQLAASGLDLEVQGPERRGDEGNLITRGRRPPERVAGAGLSGTARTDFLFSQVWATVPDIGDAGYADQHHRDLRVVQTFAAALLAARRYGASRDPWDARLAAIWGEFAAGFTGLCAESGIAAAVRARYLDAPFAAVRPAIEALLARKAGYPALCFVTRRLRDRALALTEFTLVVARETATQPVRRVQVRWAGAASERGHEFRFRTGLRRVRRSIRSGGRVALLVRSGDTLRILLDGPAPAGRRM